MTAALYPNLVSSAVSTEDDPIYDPFRRHDKYGRGGKVKQPWYEYVRLVLLGLTVFPIKLLGFLLSVISLWIVYNLACLIPKAYRQPTVVWLGKVHTRAALFWLGFARVTWVKPPGSKEGEADEPRYAAVIGNHVSTCDILVMMSRYFPSFVAKKGVANWPLVGAISQYLNCVFVDIKAKANNQQMGTSQLVMQRMHSVVAGNDPSLRPMCIFPEGTTTNGKFLIPFKTGAFRAGEPVKPHILEYSAYHVSPAWESIDLLWLLFLVLANPLHSVTITELPVYVPSEAERKDPMLYADNVRQYMLKHSNLRLSESTYKDELDYNKLISIPLDATAAKKD